MLIALESAASGPGGLKRQGVAAESAYKGAAGQRTVSQLRRNVGQSYSRFDGVMAEPMCATIEASVDDEGIFTLTGSESGHSVPVRIASAVPDTVSPLPNHPRPSSEQLYGNGLLGVGRTKKAIYACCILPSSYYSISRMIFEGLYQIECSNEASGYKPIPYTRTG